MLSLFSVSSPLHFHLPQYEGPLDLLLDLIRSQKIDIRDIPQAIACDIDRPATGTRRFIRGQYLNADLLADDIWIRDEVTLPAGIS